ncbi:MAG: dihydropteroate synthase [Acidimicrobiia bacterium]|nr:dihydropteroate synthase [Acidimicrobiia bacterium]
MGVVNVTPDSFSDGGDFYETAGAIARGREISRQGADIVDVGGESTRPGAALVSEEEESARVIPVVRALAEEGIVVSVDTAKASVAAGALAAGAEIVNDVSALGDPAMAAVVADYGAGIILMHMQGTPSTMQDAPRYDDVSMEVRRSLLASAALAESEGIDRNRICLDPGIGFGKTIDHNLTLLHDLGEFVSIGYPIVVGISRKSFIGAIAGLPDARDRDAATAGTTALAVAAGVLAVRVHDVPGNLQSARVADAIVRLKVFDEVGG